MLAMIRIISDVHLGHRASRACDPHQLAPLLEGTETLIFNGDTVEMRFAEEREESVESLGRLRALCAQAGVEPRFIHGNHDPTISDCGHLDLEAGRILVTHGHLLFHSISPWSSEAPALARAYEKALAKLPEDERSQLEKRLEAAQRAAIALEEEGSEHRGGSQRSFVRTLIREGWPPWRPLHIFRCWMQTPSRADELALDYRPQAKFVILGHTHLGGVWSHRGRTVVNTGSFFPWSRGRVLDLEKGLMRVRALHHRKSDGAFAAGKELQVLELA